MLKTSSQLGVIIKIITILFVFFISLLVIYKAKTIEAYEGFVGGMQYYERLYQKNKGLPIQKIYDHDEEVICYILPSQAISCVKDN